MLRFLKGAVTRVNFDSSDRFLSMGFVCRFGLKKDE